MLRFTSTLAGGALPHLVRKATAFRHSSIKLRAYSRIAQAHAQHGGEGRGEGREDGRGRWWSLFPLTGCVAAVAAATGVKKRGLQVASGVFHKYFYSWAIPERQM
jgi:hypothetical protein